uniref:Ribonuclease VapC n=1 Tax=Thermofilum pendens TaxID=2269 RepID=A0A7C4B8L8_THEPE
MAEKSYVDVNIFVYWLGGHPVYGERARRWIETIALSPRGSFATSSLTIYETAVILAGLTGGSLGDAGFARRLLAAFRELKGLEVAPLEEGDFERALELMERYGLDLEDALHLATLQRLGARRIISNDSDFDRAPVPRVF